VLIGAGFLVLHASLIDIYLTRATATRLHDETLSVPLQQISQGFAADGQTWIRHSLALAEGNTLRLRETDSDNAPAGREVHWNSGWAWWLVLMGKIRAALTGQPLPAALEQAARWANLPVLLLVLAGFSAWACRRHGATGAVVVALAVVGHRGFYEGFYPAYPDHHGIISATILGLALGAVFMGAGWWRARDEKSSGADHLLPASEAEALRAASLSAACGAAGLWISAASLVVPIALTGLAGMAVAVFAGRDLRAAGAVASPAVWRRWGRAGAAVSFLFYLLEYAPHHFAMRLEVNHPLYSLAWLGGGELVAGVLAWRQDAAVRRPAVLTVSLALLAVAAAPVAILWGGGAWFIPADPFMARLHAEIDEFQPLWMRMHHLGWLADRDHAGLHLLPFLAAGWLLTRRLAPAARALVIFTGAIALPATALGWWQTRWLLTASGTQIAFVLVLLGAWFSTWRETVPSWRRSAAVVGVCALLYLPAPWILVKERLLVESNHDVRPGEAMQLLYRDCAQRLRQDQPAGDIVLLASPNASTAIGYYGCFKTLGTLYWENHEGLREAAEIFSAFDDATAARRIRLRGITHVAMISDYSFLAEYFRILHPAAAPNDVRKTLGYRLLVEHRVPVWLRPIAYQMPPQFLRLKTQVFLFAVDFNQPVPDALYQIGLFQLEAGDAARARESFAAAAAKNHPESAVLFAWMLATSRDNASRDGPEALRLARFAVQALPADAKARGVLAAAFAENGRFPEANGAILNAIELAENSGDDELAARLKAQLAAYESGRPWRE
jgi:tetratricopeptide (TPR) repeat protein